MSDATLKDAVSSSEEIAGEAEQLETKKELRELADEIVEFGEQVIKENGLSTVPEKGNTASVFFKSNDNVLKSWLATDNAVPTTTTAKTLDRMMRGETEDASSVGFNYKGEGVMKDLQQKGTFGSGNDFGTKFTEAMLKKMGYLEVDEQIGRPVPGSHQEFIEGKGFSRNQASFIIDKPEKPFVVIGNAPKSADGINQVDHFSFTHRSELRLPQKLHSSRAITGTSF
jgi:hypothetical protein